MKTKLLWEIVKNFGKLLTFRFWVNLKNSPTETCIFIILILTIAFRDILYMIILPGYPEEDWDL